MALTPNVHDRLLSVLAQRALLDQGWSLPYALASDPAVLDLELEHIFARRWLLAGRDADWPTTGHRRVLWAGRVPVVVIRGEDQVLRAFVNICRHRGYPLAENETCSKRLACRYHAWTYGLDGKLLRAPGSEDDPGFDAPALALAAVAVGVWNGLVFVNASASPQPLDETLAPLEPAMKQSGVDFGRYRRHSTRDITFEAGWKLVYDNVVECYHCPGVHPATLNAMYSSEGFHDARWNGACRYGSATVKGGNLLHHSFQIFPGAMIFADPVVALLVRFWPAGPAETAMRIEYFAGPEADPAESDRFVDLWTSTLEEDRAILAGLQRAVASGRIERGRLVRGREDSLIGVQNLILDAYSEALAGDRLN
jgi:choline monooxygenase